MSASYKQVVDETLKEFPEFRIYPKSTSLMMRVFDVALKIITFGRFTTFLTGFTTTMGATMYVAPSWETKADADRAIVVRHERVHMRQARRLTRPLFSFLYALCPLPGGFAWFRARFEMEAYEETIRATYEAYGQAAIFRKEFRDKLVANFTGPAYLYMAVFQKKSVEKWVLDTVERVSSGS